MVYVQPHTFSIFSAHVFKPHNFMETLLMREGISSHNSHTSHNMLHVFSTLLIIPPIMMCGTPSIHLPGLSSAWISTCGFCLDILGFEGNLHQTGFT